MFRHQGGVWLAPFPQLDSARTLVLAFAATGYREHASALAELRAAFPTSQIAGCSSGGQIDHTQLVDHNLVVTALRFERAELRTASVSLAHPNRSRAAGAEIAHRLAADDLRAVFVFAGPSVNGAELVAGINGGLPTSVIVTGGIAGAPALIADTWVLDIDGASQQRVVAVGLYGPSLQISHGSRGGFDPFGPERQITSSTGHVVHTINGRPALALYKEYLGDEAALLPLTAWRYPLELRPTFDCAHRVVRSVLAIDEADQSLQFGCDMPVGHYVRLMRANVDRLIGGAQAAAAAAHGNHVGPALSLAISCVGRRLLLGERVEEEIEATMRARPARDAQIGFYSFGEIAPHGTGRAALHNQTMTITVVSEQR